VVGSFSALIVAWGCGCLPGIVSGGRRFPRPLLMSMTESGRNWGRQGLQAVDFDYPVIAYGEPPTAEVVVALVGLLRLDRGYDFTPITRLISLDSDPGPARRARLRLRDRL